MGEIPVKTIFDDIIGPDDPRYHESFANIMLRDPSWESLWDQQPDEPLAPPAPDNINGTQHADRREVPEGLPEAAR